MIKSSDIPVIGAFFVPKSQVYRLTYEKSK